MASCTRVGPVAAGPGPWRESGIVGERWLLLVGGAQDSEAWARGRGLALSQPREPPGVGSGRLQVCVSSARLRSGRAGAAGARTAGRASVATRPECGAWGPGLEPALPSWAPQTRSAAPPGRGAALSRARVSRHLWAPLPPGLSAEWRVAGLLVCGGRREEIEEWF